MKKIFAYIFVATSLLMCYQAKAGTLDSLQLKARIGYNIGGTSPIPLPATIRSIDSYSLTPSFMAGFDAQLPLSSKMDILP